MGVMGAPMALNLRRAGFALTVFDAVPGKCAPAVAAGARQAASLIELAAASDAVVTMLPDTLEVEAVLFGPGGLVEGLAPGSMVIEMSTIAPSAAARFAAQLAARGIGYLDAPVSGGEPGARAAKLSIMVGGDRAVYECSLPVLRALGSTIVHAGPAGAGLKTKLVNQVIGALNLLAATEGVRLARAAGLDVQSTLEAAGGGAAASWMLANLGPRIAAGDYEGGFAIRLQQKDLRLVTDFCRELGVELPGAGLVFNLFSEALARGFGNCGNQALIRLWEG